MSKKEIIKRNSVSSPGNKPIIIAMANFKGGVGKTTSSVNISSSLALNGYKVLVIDLDPQANLTQSFGIEEPVFNIYDSLVHKKDLYVVNVKENLYVIPSDLELSRAEFELASEFSREFILTNLIEQIQNDYDYIIIDCPPSLGIVTVNGLVASDYILVPIEAEFLALKGYSILDEALTKIGIEIDYVFVTKYDSRKRLCNQVREAIEDQLQEKCFNTVIRDNVSLAEAPVRGLDIFAFNNNSNGASDYRILTDEIITKIKH